MSNRIKLKGFSSKEEPTITSINLVPTWTAVAEICILVFENPKASAQSRIDVKQQIRHMAQVAAAAVEEQEAKEKRS